MATHKLRAIARKRQSAAVGSAALAVVVLTCGPASVAAATAQQQAAPSAPIGPLPLFSDHAARTSAAYSFLSGGVVQAINEGHDYADAGFPSYRVMQDQYHFDDCEFDGAAAHINAQNAKALRALSSYRMAEAYKRFGIGLHAAQDFYAHSNWVEILRAIHKDSGTPWTSVTQADLADISGASRSISTPWRAFNNQLVRSGVLLANDDWSGIGEGSVVTNGFVRTWTKADGSKVRLLESGTGAGDDECDIPYYNGSLTGFTHSQLNKDSPGRPNYTRASQLARLQSTYEWCRLVASADTVGRSGLLLALSTTRSGSPHPGQTPCKKATRNPGGSITVRVTSLRVKDVKEDGSDRGEVQLKAVLYDSARSFQRSAQSMANAGIPLSLADGQLLTSSRLPRPMTLCLPSSGTVTLALHGWDNDDGDGRFTTSFDMGDRVGNPLDDDYEDDVIVGAERRITSSIRDGFHYSVSGPDLNFTYQVQRSTTACSPQVVG